MIKLSKIYSDNNDVFPEMEFKDGLNVIFASVDKAAENRSSHSLGKTTLVDVIDFCLLKKTSANHVLRREAFSRFVFFLEIQCGDSSYVTIRRPVNGKISLLESDSRIRATDGLRTSWTHHELSLDNARKVLNEIICPQILSSSGFSYRSGLRYCFRKQTQYENTFKVNNSRESDSSWVPYLASILGIDLHTVRSKFEANQRVEALKSAIKEVKGLPKESSRSLEAEITQIEASVSRMKIDIESFDFKRSDESVSKELIEQVSQNVSTMVSQIYSLDQRIAAIDRSLKAEFSFEISKVIELFEEVEIHFPEKLVKSYEDLININQAMSSGRKERLAATKRRILEEKEVITSRLDEQRKRQQELTSLLLQKDAFEKYKSLQKRLASEEARVAVLKERLEKIDTSTELGRKLIDAESEKKRIGKELQSRTKIRGNDVFTRAVTIFSRLAEHALGISAFFYSDTNKDGNIQFKVGVQDQTSVNEGFSYTRVLSAIFDATLLILYSRTEFYRFCYHDGLLESLDDRLKLRLIEEWRKISLENGLQFIITVLDSDIPLKNGEKNYFHSNEIIRELHDRGESGRLFRMPAF